MGFMKELLGRPLQAGTKEPRGNSTAELFPSTALRRMTFLLETDTRYTVMQLSGKSNALSVLEIGSAGTRQKYV